MSKLLTRIIVLGLCAVLTLVSAFYEMWLFSHYFIGTIGFLLGVIGMKEKDKLSTFALSHGVDIDKGELDESGKKEDSR